MTTDDSHFADRSLRTPDDSLGFLLWRATHAWQRYLEQVLAGSGLTHLRWALLVGLSWLTKDGAAKSQRQLADFIDIHPMQVSQVVSGMEKAGLIARTPSAEDRRVVLLCLTAAGELALKSAMPLVEKAHQDFFEPSNAAPGDLRGTLIGLLKQS